MRASPNFQRSLMTESIAPETAKLATTPKPATSIPLKTPDKPESVGKTESSTKLSPTPEAPKPAPSVLTPSSGGLGHHVGNKKKAAIVASALFSLIAGIAGVRLMWPATDDTKSTETPTQPLTNGSKEQTGSTGNNIPPAAVPPLPNSTQSATPPQPGLAPLQPPPARYMITDLVLADLRAVKVPETVLMKFTFVKNKDLSQQDMDKEIATVLSPAEKQQYQSYILYYAKQPDTPAAPSSKPIETASQPLVIPSPGPQQPLAPPPPNIVPSVLAPLQPPTDKQPARFMITDLVLTDLRTAKVPEIVLTKLTPAKNKEFSEEGMEKEIATALTAEEKRQYQTSILYYAKQPDKPAAPSSKPIETTSQPATPSSARFMITDLVLTNLRAEKIPETVLMKFTFVKNKEFSQEGMEKEIATALTAEEKQQYQNYILYYAKQSDKPTSTSATPVPDLPGFGIMPPPNTGVVSPGSQIIPTGGLQTPNPVPTPTVPSPTPMLPTVPTGAPSVPSVSTVPQVPALPSPMPVVPPLPSPNMPMPPLSGDPILKPQPPSPGTGLPGTPVVGMPIIPAPSGPGTVPTVPPVIPDLSPGISPVASKPPGVSVSPPSESGNSGGGGTAVHLTKPPASPPATSVTAIERSPTTSYDVDLYEPKANDSWETISQEFYNDKRYAAALQAANKNKPLTSGGMVDIPPIYILKQKFQTPAGTRTPTGQTSPPPSPPPSWAPSVATTPATPSGQTSTPPSWAPSVATTPATPSGGTKTYRVPPGGITMQAIARNYLGSDQRWQEIYNLNPQFTKPDGVIPEGTDIRLPADAKLP